LLPAAAAAQDATNDAEIRADLERILAEPRFGRADQPQQGFFERLWREVLFNFLQWLSRVAADFPGGEVVFYGLLLIAVVALGVWAGLSLGKRRNRAVEARQLYDRSVAKETDPAELEFRAESAAGRGDFAEAIRLRFLAGLLRLDAAGLISYAPGLINHEVSQVLDDEDFDRLWLAFDAVVYGDAPAGAVDHQLAVAGWKRLLANRSSAVR
jgi:hypothetical protein